jgi:hypothetical protein
MPPEANPVSAVSKVLAGKDGSGCSGDVNRVGGIHMTRVELVAIGVGTDRDARIRPAAKIVAILSLLEPTAFGSDPPRRRAVVHLTVASFNLPESRGVYQSAWT